MLFTTPTFILIFLPLALAGFFMIGRFSALGAAAWLLGASLVFYSHWMPADTLLLVGSIAANFYVGMRISQHTPAAKRWLILGIGFNLGLLAWFKYASFMISNLDSALGLTWPVPKVALPIGISFYTFTQIAFLVDTYQCKVQETKPVHYGLFVTYFPHLVAGPVLHHAQMMPQFADRSIYRLNTANLAGGLVIFGIGLFKKIVLADGVSPYADAVFKPADAGIVPDAIEAWIGALAYTCQLYFDFSGYSDMAIGLSWMFNVRLPFNFNSPYKASNISEFWRRWHISLSTFLRDYLYIAMGGNRHGAVRRYINLAATMVLGGLWHGANWTFVLWGALHGCYLMLHHGFRAICGVTLHARLQASRLWRLLAWAMTMLSVLAAWVVFRAETLAGSLNMLRGMTNLTASAASHELLWNAGLQAPVGATWCLVLGAMACLAPNSNRIGTYALEVLQQRKSLRAVAAGWTIGLILLLMTINANRSSVSAFIYFNF
jgi:alginate O-acetyltransferase complex protein AlgI